MDLPAKAFIKRCVSFWQNKNIAYEAAKNKEIAQFKDIQNIHELPDIFHYWSNKYLLPVMLESGYSSIDTFYAANLANTQSKHPHFISIGAGYCDTEIRIVKLLKSMGHRRFTFECLELNPHLLARGQAMAEQEGLGHHMVFTEADFNHWQPNRTYAGVMANHSLHHVVNLEGLFDQIKHAMDKDAHFVTSDMIGRNGHQRWPEALEIVNAYWQQLPEHYRYNHQLKRQESDFINWDCSNEGFEGIRAQDILPLLLERFHFKYFFGFANVVSPFIDRGFGHHFDAAAEWDKAFIDQLQAIDEAGFASGKLKPTQMLAVMTKSATDKPFYAHGLSPKSAVRNPST